ncbi:MAG: hypothetical protein LBH43_12840 [Treponema sp.]|jgi:hypothetical protein|nr:hypothetical protein [Treponema sp.]
MNGEENTTIERKANVNPIPRTLRDYFAGQVLVGICASGVYSPITCAETSYKIADAMLAERAREKEK